VSFGIGSKDDDYGISASGNALGGTISVASEEVAGVAKTGVSLTVPLGDLSLTVSAADDEFWGASVSTSLAGATVSAADDEFWGASVSTSLAGATVSAGTDSNDDTQVGISTTLAGGFGLAADFDTGNGTELQLSYSLSDSATVTVSYNEDKDRDDDDDYTPGTQAQISFNF